MNPQERSGGWERGERVSWGLGQPHLQQPPASVHWSPRCGADTGAAVVQGLRGSSVAWSLKGEVLVPGQSRPSPPAQCWEGDEVGTASAAPLPVAAGRPQFKPHVIQQILIPRADRLPGFSVTMAGRGPGNDTPLLRPSLQVAGLPYSSVMRRQAFPLYKWGNQGSERLYYLPLVPGPELGTTVSPSSGASLILGYPGQGPQNLSFG